MSKSRELVATAVACSLAVGAVTLIATDRRAEDWRIAALCVCAVLVGTMGTWLLKCRRDRRPPRTDLR